LFKGIRIGKEKHKEFVDNAKALIQLIEESSDDNIFLKAELYRNIGDFINAMNLLNKIEDSDRKSILMNEIKEKNSNVVIILQRDNLKFKDITN